MSGLAHIISSASISPTKAEIAADYAGLTELLGSYRLYDFSTGEVGIEILIGRDLDGRLNQMPLTYRGAQLSPEATFCTMEHSEYGTRWISNALADPIAVREFLRTILTGDDGAAYDSGAPILQVRGSGNLEVEVGEVTLSESTRQRAVGSVLIDGVSRAFKLRVPNLLKPATINATGHTTTKLHLAGTFSQGSEEGTEVILAEFSWRDQVV